MNSQPQDVDHRVLKLIVGLIALTLGPLTLALVKIYFPGEALTSISASYWYGGWPQAFFIGFLFAIASFVAAYQGVNRWEAGLSKVAAGCAAAIALFPCKDVPKNAAIPVVKLITRPPNGVEAVPAIGLHGAAAVVMFLILSVFCFGFWRRASDKAKAGNTAARWRAAIYAGCFGALVGAMVTMGLAAVQDNFAAAHPKVVFWGELFGLTAFGVSWLIASKVAIADQTERLHLW